MEMYDETEGDKELCPRPGKLGRRAVGSIDDIGILPAPGDLN